MFEISEIFMRFPGGRQKALTLSYDDGKEQDIRMIEIMKKHGIKGTFNLSSGLFPPEGTTFPEGFIHRNLTREQCKALYTDSGMEVALHGLTHPIMTLTPPPRLTYEILQNRLDLEEDYGCMVRGMAYPYGPTNDQVVECLKMCGVAYARTTVSSLSFQIPTDWLRLAGTCAHGHPQFMEFARQFVEGDNGSDALMFYVFGHSYEFELHDNWQLLEDFCAYIGGREDIWYATNIEIYDYVEAYRQLIYSANGKMVYNPTCRTLHFVRRSVPYSGELQAYTIQPGETIRLD